jgi:hypothetical protein
MKVTEIKFSESTPLDERVDVVFRMAKSFFELGKTPKFLDRSTYIVPKADARQGLLGRTEDMYVQTVAIEFDKQYAGCTDVDAFEMSKYFLSEERLSLGYFKPTLSEEEKAKILASL